MRIGRYSAWAAVLSLSLISFSASSIRHYATDTYYYDAPGGNLVGNSVIPCQGPEIFEGIRTQYAVTTQWSCWPYDPPPGGGGDP